MGLTDRANSSGRAYDTWRAVALAVLLGVGVGVAGAILPAPYVFAVCILLPAMIWLLVRMRTGAFTLDGPGWSLLAVLIALPMALHISAQGISLGRPVLGRMEGESVSLNAVVVACWSAMAILLLVLGRETRVRGRLWKPVLWFVLANTMALSFGWLRMALAGTTSLREMLSSALIAAQIVVPLIAYLLVVNSRVSAPKAMRLMAIMMGVVGIWALAQTLQTARVVGVDMFRGKYAEYISFFGARMYTVQYATYWPTVVSVLGTYLAALLLIGRRRSRTATLAITAALLAVIAYQAFLGERRAAVLTLFFGCILVAGFARNLKVSLGLLAMIAGFAVALAAAGDTVAFVRFSYLIGPSQSRSVSERLDVMRGAAGRIVDNPIVGAAYTPFDAGDPLEDGILRIPSAHNFYLDLAQKAGLVALLLYLVLLALASHVAWRVARWADDPSTRVVGVTVFVSFVLVSLVSNQLQNTFSQLYPGIFFWTLIALCEIALPPVRRMSS